MIIAILFFSAGWLAGRMRMWSATGHRVGQNKGAIRSTAGQAREQTGD